MSPPDRMDAVVLAEHLEALAQAAQLVARDLRSALAAGSESMACLGRGTDGEPPVNLTPKDGLLNTKSLAERLDIGVRTLRRWRHEGRAPKPLRGKGPLRWDPATVDRWLEEHAP